MKKDRFKKGILSVLIGFALFIAACFYPPLQNPLFGLGGVAVGLGAALIFQGSRGPQPGGKMPYTGKNKSQKNNKRKKR